MAKNVTLWGASYSGVPSLVVPQTGGGSAQFYDVSNTTATASDVASGKYFYTAAGVRTAGTGSGGGGGGGNPWTIDGVGTNSGAIYYLSCYCQQDPGTIGALIAFRIESLSPPSDGDVIAYLYDSSGVKLWVYDSGSVTAVSGVTGGVTWGGTELFIEFDNGSYKFTAYEEYSVIFVHGGDGSLTWRTTTYQPPSGVTSGQFSVSENPPVYFIGLETSVALASYHRVNTVTKWDEDTMLVGTNFYTNTIGYLVNDLTETYSNGTLTVATSGINNGGYFHNPGTYTLYYFTSADLSGGGGGNYQAKAVTPTTSQQIVTADSGYDALSQVTVSAMPSGTAGTPTASKGTVYNHAVSVTPSVTNATGYIAGGTKTGTAVSVSASELVSGSQTITSNGTVDVTNLASVTVNVSGGSSKNVQVVQGTTRSNSSTATAIGAEMTVSKTGTYDVYWSGMRTNTSTSYTWGTQLYVGGSAYGSENTTWSNHVQNNHLTNVSLTVNQKIRVYGRGRSGSYYVYAPTLVIVEA